MQSKEKVATPANKAYPFTVEVILEEKEQNSLDKKLDFSPKLGRNTDIHSNAANVLNSTGISWQKNMVVNKKSVKLNTNHFLITLFWRIFGIFTRFFNFNGFFTFEIEKDFSLFL